MILKGKKKKPRGGFLILDLSMYLCFAENKLSRVLKTALATEFNIITESSEWNIYKNKHWTHAWARKETGPGFV